MTAGIAVLAAIGIVAFGAAGREHWIAVIWPANALPLAWLLAARRRPAPASIARIAALAALGSAAGTLAAGLAPGTALAAAVAAAADVAAATVAAWSLPGPRPGTLRPAGTIKLGLAVGLLGPAAGALLAITIAAATGARSPPASLAANALGALLFVPAFMILAAGGRRPPALTLTRRSLVALGLLLAMLGLAAAQPMPGGLVAFVLLLTLFGVFAGAVPTAFAVAAAGLIPTLLTLHGLGPLVTLSDDPARRLAMLQRFLALCVLGAVPAVLIMEQRGSQLARLRLEQARLRLREARYRAMATISADVILVTVPGGRITYVSPAVQRLLGIAAPALIGCNAFDFIHPRDAERVAAEFATLGGPVREMTVEMQIWPGGVGAHEAPPIWAEVRTRLGERADGDEAELVSVVRDISARRAQDERRSADLARLARLAHTDSLTGLANRRRFTEHLELEWRRALREQSEIGLILIDVDRFKSFNDLYGHPAGDAALQGVAAIIAATTLRPADLAARIGGEEFAVILPNTFLSGARSLAERIRDGLRVAAIPHLSSPSDLLTVSIGICCLRPDQIEPPQLLIDRADQALYAAKVHRDTVTIAN